MLCPNCGKPLVERVNSKTGSRFLGCSGFRFGCKYTQSIKNASTNPPVENKPISEEVRVKVDRGEFTLLPSKHTPSDQQVEIYKEFFSGESNILIVATAGSGKSTTLENGLAYADPSLSTSILVFGKKNTQDLIDRNQCPKHVVISTINAKGMRDCFQGIRGLSFDEDKLEKLLKQYIYDRRIEDPEKKKILEKKTSIFSCVDLLKANLLIPSDQNIYSLYREYPSISFEMEDLAFFTRIIFNLYHASINLRTVIDYSDQVFFPASGIVPSKMYDLLLLDEDQDLNKAQIALALKSGKRIIGVGDPYQSIYAFRGADSEAIPNLIKALSPKILPLSTCYRCSKVTETWVNQEFPEIEFSVPDTAKEGKIEEISYEKFLSSTIPGDLVLCRNNAPLVKPCFNLISKGIKAVILGRDIGKNLKKTVQTHAKDESLVDTLHRYSEWYVKEYTKLVNLELTKKADSLKDTFDCIIALSEGINTVSELLEKIEMVFSDDNGSITFSSIHKAKGAEAERVFLLDLFLIGKNASTPKEVQQERNLKFVAITRSKEFTFLVNTPK